MFADRFFLGSARVLRVSGCVCLALLLGVAGAHAASRPVGTSGPEAEALAQRMLAAVNDAAWQETGAVRWSFRGNREHLWDRRRSLARVSWDDVEVLTDLSTRRSLVRRKGRQVVGSQAEKLAEKAYAYWVNDSFWLNPVSKVFDSGTERSLVTLDDGSPALLVEYSSGGLTPGDAYLWIIDDEGLPTAWRMWVSVLPVGGTKATWERWTTLSTGARIATLHDLRLGKVTIENLTGATDLPALLDGAPDPFESLLALPPD